MKTNTIIVMTGCVLVVMIGIAVLLSATFRRMSEAAVVRAVIAKGGSVYVPYASLPQGSSLRTPVRTPTYGIEVSILKDCPKELADGTVTGLSFDMQKHTDTRRFRIARHLTKLQWLSIHDYSEPIRLSFVQKQSSEKPKIRVSFTNCEITPHLLSALASEFDCESLSFSHCLFDPVIDMILPESFATTEKLSFGGKLPDDLTLQAMTLLPKLKSLSLSNSALPLNVESLQCRRLTEINFYELTSVNLGLARQLAKNNGLERLDVVNCDATEEGWLNEFADCENLKSVRLRGRIAPIARIDCEALARMEKLNFLELHDVELSESQSRIIAKSQSLVRVYVLGMLRADEFAYGIADSKSIRFLEFQFCDLSECGLAELARMQSLQWAEVYMPSQSKDSVRSLRIAIPGCVVNQRYIDENGVEQEYDGQLPRRIPVEN